MASKTTPGWNTGSKQYLDIEPEYKSRFKLQLGEAQFRSARCNSISGRLNPSTRGLAYNTIRLLVSMLLRLNQCPHRHDDGRSTAAASKIKPGVDLAL
ncbi:hypothetical protein CTRI78_v003217 [Colletotrichum trifolii]|uniref:Uncharacterized protein n=1 Tax=Colletotrichum trifolii TaxID=5466 RepID=A0A4R8RW06_COLTR|nr:hypothetical protein CTRI78_v003217 [Colletotrichum trifolii]